MQNQFRDYAKIGFAFAEPISKLNPKWLCENNTILNPIQQLWSKIRIHIAFWGAQAHVSTHVCGPCVRLQAIRPVSQPTGQSASQPASQAVSQASTDWSCQTKAQGMWCGCS